jgi:hypothetical protein
MKPGYLYILTSAAMPDLIKIGVTTKHPLQRTEELSAPTGIPVPFTLAYHRAVNDIFSIERDIHEAFAEYRVSDKREFFHMSYMKAASLIDILLGDPSFHFDPPTPFAELFNSFEPQEDDSPYRDILTPEENAQCQKLIERIAVK